MSASLISLLRPALAVAYALLGLLRLALGALQGGEHR